MPTSPPRSPSAPALTAPAVARTPIGRYVVAPVVSGRRTADDLHDVARGDELGKVIDTVLAVEAPIHAALLARRVATAYGIGRMTPKVVERVRMIAATRAQVGSPDDPDVVSRRDQDPAALAAVRVPDDSRPDSKRDGEHLPLVELAAAARIVLERNLGLPRADLVRETAKLVGFARPGDKLAARLEAAIAVLIARGGASATGERVALGDG